MFPSMVTERIKDKMILIIEDSPTQAMYLQTMLEEQGLQVVLAADGAEGVTIAQQLRPDLIVLDTLAPEMDSMRVCQHLKRRYDTYYIPVIMLTRPAELASISPSMQQGMINPIPKDGFTDAVLLETLRQMGLIKRVA